MYAQIIEMAESLDANQRVRAEAAHVRAVARALRLRARYSRAPERYDMYDEERLRQLLCDVVSNTEALISWVEDSRGSVCQACGSGIEPHELEFYVAAESSELRLDLACYSTLSDWRAENGGDDLSDLSVYNGQPTDRCDDFANDMIHGVCLRVLVSEDAVRESRDLTRQSRQLIESARRRIRQNRRPPNSAGG